ncbi:hypothetical protein ACP4OV_013774 [Aristida adscensionis]
MDSRRKIVRTLEELERYRQGSTGGLSLAVGGFLLREAEAMAKMIRTKNKNLRWDSKRETLAVLDSAAALFNDLGMLNLQLDLIRLDVEDQAPVSILRLNQLLQAASAVSLRCLTALRSDGSVGFAEAVDSTEAAIKALDIGRQADQLGGDRIKDCRTFEELLSRITAVSVDISDLGDRMILTD